MDFSSSFTSFVAMTIAVISAICTITWYLYGGYMNKSSNKRYVPVAGTVLSLMINFNKAFDYITEISHEHKTYRFLNLFRSEVFTSDPSNVEYILKTNFVNYAKGRVHHEILSDLLGDGIFTVDGEKWQKQRKSSSYVFSTRMLKDFSYEVFLTKAKKLAQIVSEAAISNQPIEIQDLFMKSTLDSIVKVIMGKDVDSLHGTNEEGTVFTKAFDEANAITACRYFDPFWKIKRFLNIGSEARLRECVPIIDRYVYKLIESKAKQVHSSQEGSQMMRRDLLSRFLEIDETDTKFLKDIILNYIIAGKDTTASTLSWFIYMMCKNPPIQDKVAQDVLKATNLVQKRPSFINVTRNINEEALGMMQYLHAALTETLRLYPAVPVDGKLCLSDDTLPDGSSVRKGDIVAYTPYPMGRMRWIWGHDAEVFRPERWLNQDNIFQPQSPFKFTAFQAGPRICLGKDFAYRQMKVFLAVLVGAFVFKLSDEQKPVTNKTMLTLHIDGGLNVRASPRFNRIIA